ncbi:MAG TPA: hypothetical protein VGB91_12835 [Rhizomicrobium sp.]
MLRRLVLIGGIAALLAGCDSVGDLNSDAFDPGDASQTRFTFASDHCAEQAAQRRDYDIRSIGATHAERHEIYNRAYSACMTANGYVRRGWSPDILDPYTIDPLRG